VYPLRARLQELKEANPPSRRKGCTTEDELTDLRNGEQAFMAIRPQRIRAGYTTLDSIPRIQKASGVRFYCPPLKGVDSKTQDIVTKWIQKLHKFPADLHAIDIKEAQTQRDPGVERMGGIRTSQLADKYIVKRNKIRNQCALLKNQGEEGVQHYLDKLEELKRACDKLLRTWRTQSSPLGDSKVKETMYHIISKTEYEPENWRDNTSTEESLTSLKQIETSLNEIRDIDTAILREEEDAATEFPSLLKLLTKKTRIFGNNAYIREWWYEVMSERPPPPIKKRGELHKGNT